MLASCFSQAYCNLCRNRKCWFLEFWISWKLDKYVQSTPSGHKKWSPGQKKGVEKPNFIISFAVFTFCTNPFPLPLFRHPPPHDSAKHRALVNHCSHSVLSCRKWRGQAGVLGNQYIMGRERGRKKKGGKPFGKVSHTHTHTRNTR